MWRKRWVAFSRSLGGFGQSAISTCALFWITGETRPVPWTWPLSFISKEIYLQSINRIFYINYIYIVIFWDYVDLDFLSEINILKTFFFLPGLLSFQNQNILQLLKAHRNIPCLSWQEIAIILSSNCSDCGKVRMLDYMCQHVKIRAAQWTACWRLDWRRGVYRCKLWPVVDSSATSAFLHLH